MVPESSMGPRVRDLKRRGTIGTGLTAGSPDPTTFLPSVGVSSTIVKVVCLPVQRSESEAGMHLVRPMGKSHPSC